MTVKTIMAIRMFELKLTNYITTWSKFHVGKMIVVQLVKYPPSRTRMFNAVFTQGWLVDSQDPVEPSPHPYVLFL